MSSPVYELLKRPDELFVVEHAHLQPRFVEDSVRIALGSARRAARARGRRLPLLAAGQPRDDPRPRRARRALRNGRRAARRAARAPSRPAAHRARRLARRVARTTSLRRRCRAGAGSGSRSRQAGGSMFARWRTMTAPLRRAANTITGHGSPSASRERTAGDARPRSTRREAYRVSEEDDDPEASPMRRAGATPKNAPARGRDHLAAPEARGRAAASARASPPRRRGRRRGGRRAARRVAPARSPSRRRAGRRAARSRRPKARQTFVAPMLPLPTVRMSSPFASRTSQ